MRQTSKLSQRFVDLLGQIESVFATKHYKSDAYISGDYVDHDLYQNWVTKAQHLVSLACGNESVHYAAFLNAGKSAYGTNYKALLRMKAVFEAAQEDYDGGYFNSVRSLIQAEVFSDELEQATELLTADCWLQNGGGSNRGRSP